MFQQSEIKSNLRLKTSQIYVRSNFLPPGVLLNHSSFGNFNEYFFFLTTWYPFCNSVLHYLKEEILFEVRAGNVGSHYLNLENVQSHVVGVKHVMSHAYHAYAVRLQPTEKLSLKVSHFSNRNKVYYIKWEHLVSDRHFHK